MFLVMFFVYSTREDVHGAYLQPNLLSMVWGALRRKSIFNTVRYSQAEVLLYFNDNNWRRRYGLLT